MIRLVLALLSLLVVSRLAAQTVLVQPYVQPGDGSTLGDSDVKVIAWLTDQTPGEFVVEFGADGAPFRETKPERVTLDFAGPIPPRRRTEVPTSFEELRERLAERIDPGPPKDKEQHYYKYAATLTQLPFGSTISYRVKLGGSLVRDGSFRARATPQQTIRFIAVGDLAQGSKEQNRVAFQMWKAQPDFLIALGDIVYSDGRVSEYERHFWKTYNNVTAPSPKAGAPLMQTVPIYPVLGNHDVGARLDDKPDALGVFYFFHGPLNGPGLGSWNVPLGKNGKRAATFRKNVGSSYPALGVYSFDSGPAHFLVLDTNMPGDSWSGRLVDWIQKDLSSSKQPWKFVCFHAPSFHTSPHHYEQQKMRLLEPIFAANGVDVVFSGHVHNYQRTKPLRFTPMPPVRDKRGRVNGTFDLDETFDGVADTTPEGVIHIVSGGGGAALYNSKDFAATVAQLERENVGNWAPFTAKFIADRHSFSLVELSLERFTLRQVSLDGDEVDRFTITKPAQK
jgi:predicted phosphodiesterase